MLERLNLPCHPFSTSLVSACLSGAMNLPTRQGSRSPRGKRFKRAAQQRHLLVRERVSASYLFWSKAGEEIRLFPLSFQPLLLIRQVPAAWDLEPGPTR